MRRPSQYLSSPQHRYYLSNMALLLMGVLGALFHWFTKSVRGFDLAGDVADVWIPVASCVVNGGELYLCHWDNKPPLFHFLNVGFTAVDAYLLLFFLTMGVANGVAAILIRRLCREWGYGLVGVISAVLFLALMANMTNRINPRNYANVFLLYAFLASGPIRTGVSVAIAGLFSQFAVFIIPAVIWFRNDLWNPSYRWLAKFGGAGLATVAIAFGIVAAFWSVEAAVTGFQYAFLDSGEYVGEYSQRGLALYGSPIAWVYKLYRLLSLYLWLVLGGMLGVYAIQKQDGGPTKFEPAILLATLLTAIPLTIRTAPVYLVMITPFLTILCTLGLKYAFEETNN